MSALDAAFQRVDVIFGIYFAIIISYGLIARSGRRGGAMAIAVINHGGLIGLASILAMPFISPFPVDPAKFVTGVLIELFCAVVFLLASWEIIRFLRRHANIIGDQYICLLILAKVGFFTANYIASDGQYGIFSDDSRIDFLMLSPVVARTWYLDLLVDFIVLLNVGLRCVSSRTFRLRDLLIVAAVICLSLLTGSKGAVFLMIAYVALLIIAAFPDALRRVPKWLIALIIALCAAAAYGYIYLLSEVLRVPVSDQLSLTLSRFLLSADARIMAFDPNITDYVMMQPHGIFLAELFRGPARLFGLQTAEFQVGVYQYQYQLSTTNFVGSNNQLSALFMIYGGYFWLIEFFVVSGLMFLAYRILRKYIRSGNSALGWASAASFFWLSDTLCKGYESYVQLLPICMLIIASLALLREFGRTAARRRGRRLRMLDRGESSVGIS